MTNIVGKIGKKNIVQIHNENPKNLLKDNEILVTENGSETQFAEKINGKVVDYVRGDKASDTPITPAPAEKTGVDPELVSYMYYTTASMPRVEHDINIIADWLYGYSNENADGVDCPETLLYSSAAGVTFVKGTYEHSGKDDGLLDINITLNAKKYKIEGIEVDYPFMIAINMNYTAIHEISAVPVQILEDNIAIGNYTKAMTSKFRIYDSFIFIIADTKGNVYSTSNYYYYTNGSGYTWHTRTNITVDIEE